VLSRGLSRLVVLRYGTGSLLTAGFVGREIQQSSNPMRQYRTQQIFAALVEDFIASPGFGRLTASTRRLWEREVRQAADLDEMGCILLGALKRSHVVGYLDKIADRPGKQEAALSAIRAVEQWALDRGFIDTPFCYRIKIKRQSKGHKPWSDAQVQHAIANARPDLARMVALGAWTGQRGGDLVRMAWEDVETIRGRQWIKVVQWKTKLQLLVPVAPELAALMGTWGRTGPLLRRMDGSPWPSRELLTKAWLYERKTNPALAEHRRENLHIHGLRAHACVRLYLAGYTTRQVAKTVGMSLDMVEHYTALSSQQAEAEAAIEMAERSKNVR